LRDTVRAIQWHIYHHGTKGRHMFSRTFEKDKAKVEKCLRKIPEDIVKALEK